MSRRGNVACSLLERFALPPAALAGLSLVSGVAVARVLRERFGVDVRIKWPNDLLVDGAKLVGLLTTVQACPGATTPCAAVVTGVGVNVVRDRRVAGLGVGATSLAELGVDGVDRDALIGRIACALLDDHGRFFHDGWGAFASEWRALDWLAGREVDLHGVAGVETGRALGVDADGALRVRIAGRERLVHGGEVSVRARERA